MLFLPGASRATANATAACSGPARRQKRQLLLASDTDTLMQPCWHRSKRIVERTIQALVKVKIDNIFIGPRCTWGPIYGSRSLSLSKRRFADLTDVTLADKDTNSMRTGNVAMKVIQPGGQIFNQMIVGPSGGQFCNQFK